MADNACPHKSGEIVDVEVIRWDAALQQLATALGCYEKADFLSAVTLGAAAEELLSKELAEHRPDLKPAREADKNVHEFFYSGAVTESVAGMKDQPVRKSAADAMGGVQNFLKHGSVPTLKFDPDFEAADRLQRSVDMVFWITQNPTLRDDWNHRVRFLHRRQ